MRKGGVYRVSIPASLAKTVALPWAYGHPVDFSSLPLDWPSDDRSDATRVRAEFMIPLDGVDVSVADIGGIFSGHVKAWLLITPV